MNLELLPLLLDWKPPKELRDAFIVHAQNIADWILDPVIDGAEPKDPKSLIPNLAAPFPSMYVEAKLSTVEDIQDSTGRKSFSFGTLLYWTKPKDEEEAKNWLERFGVVCALNIQVFSRLRGGPVRGGLAACAGLDPDYRIARFDIGNRGGETFADIEHVAMVVALSSVSFFHCKNVTIRKVESRCRHPRKYERHHGFSMPSFHVIEVHKATKHTVGQPPSEHGARAATAAFVRGHFKRFGADGKLFGKHEGLWFWDMHVRGSDVPLRSEYRPWPPEGEHRKECLVQL